VEAPVGYEDLLAALRREGENKSGLIRQEAEAEAARLREEAAAGRVRLREGFEQEQARAIAAECGAILAEAERTARRIRLAEAGKRAERLYRLALGLLPHLRERDYPGMFSRLAAELPPAAWETVRVNPADGELAGYLFPTALIEPDPAISGGMEALAGGGRIRVVNTLEKRLERGWPELLPDLLGEAERCVS
jgi:V/A-type H+-transporting ATPase subunit E